MQKKPGQISSNTLNLRFMQNAAKAREEEEREAARVRVRTEEEWEVGEEVRKAWGVVGGDEGRRVSYEESYLPFLFPGLAARAVKPNTEGAHTYKGRRKFGKHGLEEAEETPAPPQIPAPPPETDTLPRGARSISSHGRTAPSKPPKSSHRPPRAPIPPSSLPAPTPAPREFMKPPIDAPRSQPPPETALHKRRHAHADAGAHGDRTTTSDAQPAQPAQPAQRKKKKTPSAVQE